MRLGCFLLTLAAVGAAAQRPAILKVSLSGHAMILNNVFLNGSGPFRMLLDTGNAGSAVRPGVASRLNLQTAYSVEHASVAGTARVPVALLDEVRAGDVVDRLVEVMISEIAEPGLDGVLGESWLVRHDYLLDYRNKRVVFDGAGTAKGVRLPFRSGDGRPVVVASIDGRQIELVVDSGASAMVLFEKPGDEGEAVTLRANGGSVDARKFTARFALSGDQERRLEAVRVDLTGLGPGLLPAGAFSSVFVSNHGGFVEFVH